MKTIIRRIKRRLKRLFYHDFPRFCSQSGVMSSIYYLLFNSAFRRENQAVLAGRMKHLNDAQKEKANYFLLVRNIHRIEKGLLMKPRKAVFGKDYIHETLDSFEGIWKASELNCNPQLKWFHDVLTAYFDGVQRDQELEQLFARFKQKTLAINGSEKAEVTLTPSIPYARDLQNRSTISYPDFYVLARQRRSVRWYSNKAVAREYIDQAILAANQSPSACNRQPFEFRIFDEPELVKQLVDYPMGTRGYGHNIPVLVVLVGNLDAYFDERDRHIIYIDASLAAMSFMFALETLGLGSCPINWPDVEAREKKMEQFLKLKKHQRPLMCIGLGYADPEGLVAFSEKRPIDKIRRYNFINQ